MDTYNKKNLVMLAACIMAVSYFGFSASKTVPWLMAFRLVQGAGQAFSNVCCLAMVSEAIPKEKYVTGIGYFSLAQVIARPWARQPALGLVGPYGYSATFVHQRDRDDNGPFYRYADEGSVQAERQGCASLSIVVAKEALIPSFVMMFLYMGFAVINPSGRLCGKTADQGEYRASSSRFTR